MRTIILIFLKPYSFTIAFHHSVVYLVILYALLASIQPIQARSFQADSTSYAFLPSFGYNSDVGIAGGLALNRYSYKTGINPYKSFIDLSTLVSSKGYYNARLTYNRPEVFGTNARTNLEIIINRTLNDNYFGIGNQTSFSNNLWDDNHYNFESISFEIDVRTRHPLSQKNTTKVDFLSLAGFSYNIPYDNGNKSLIEVQQPLGFKGGWVNYVGIGLMWDNRDNEFATTFGNQSSIELYLMPELLFSDYQMAVFLVEAKQFITLSALSNTVLALRGNLEHSFGDVPFWKLPYLGGENSIRGYPKARFRDSSAMFYNVELRNWIFTDEEYDVKLGAHIFSDAGRVFNHSEDWDRVFLEHKRTWGLGLAFSTFSSDIIFRADYAFSRDMNRFYLGLGYLF
ncbi:MAG: BamA/TamA family outer membrane protein [Balneolales bacterium]